MSTTAKIILDSLSPNGVRLTTFELYMPRIILPEFNTHRMFSRNASSSRAIPTSRIIGQVKGDPFIPSFWGKNIPGMQANEEITEVNKAKAIWRDASVFAVETAQKLLALGLHKQTANRILEPFMYTKVICTATEYANFFNLRANKDAQPEIQDLAYCMLEAINNSTPTKLEYGQYHLPYIKSTEQDTVENLIKFSVARCARVSYNNHDGSTPDPNKDVELYDSLLSSRHLSPFEHVATPIETNEWCANLYGWRSVRNRIPGESGRTV
jgi:thymidylate synthase ThyX